MIINCLCLVKLVYSPGSVPWLASAWLASYWTVTVTSKVFSGGTFVSQGR
jgi:hypothetical protein